MNDSKLSTNLLITEDELEVLYLLVDLRVYREGIKPLPSKFRWWHRLKCRLGLHVWGFVHCLCCGHKDHVLANALYTHICSMRPAQRSALLAKVRADAHTIKAHYTQGVQGDYDDP